MKYTKVLQNLSKNSTGKSRKIANILLFELYKYAQKKNGDCNYGTDR